MPCCGARPGCTSVAFMRKDGETVHLTASDLVGHLNCRYLTALDLSTARGEIAKPSVWDPVLEVLAERGAQHEKAYIDHLKGKGDEIRLIGGIGVEKDAVNKTVAAMKGGASIVVQAALQDGVWSGRADVLRRVEKPSVFGAWSYEVVDTKLAKETKGGTVLQLSLYSELLASMQKKLPEFSYVVTPETGFEPEIYRTTDYSAYYRRVRRSLEQSVDNGTADDLYPEPNPHCDICRWRRHCDEKRRKDDHLSLVAGISKSQIGELRRHDVGTTATLAEVVLPWPWKPDRGAAQSYEKIREQARLQVKGRTEGKVIHEALPIQPGFGLCCLPEPSPGDIFFDLEGDPFVRGGGLEFLFGYAYQDESGQAQHRAEWSFTRADEKAAFERFVDFVFESLKTYPGLHIYHFAPYEPAALKRLMGRYAAREEEIDRLLRGGVLVDLFAVIRHSIRASVESYSIKKLEPLYEYKRAQDLSDAGKILAKVQACLELGDVQGIEDADRKVVDAYNKDDCLSAWALRDWLEGLRAELLTGGATIDRPEPKSGDASEKLTAWQQRIAPLVQSLTQVAPVDVTDRTPDEHARWLLGNVLDFHGREIKATWWEYFRLSALSAEELLDERAAISGLTFAGNVGGTAKAPIHRYSFPAQETELRGDEDLRAVGGKPFGKVNAISLDDRTVDIKKRQDSASLHPEAIFSHKVIGTEEQAEALVRIAEYVIANGMKGPGRYQAARDLLLFDAPKIGGQPIRNVDETTLSAAVRISPAFEPCVFPIQGPPGAGKTHIGARMICALVATGKKVGITANSHKVIRNLLDEIQRACKQSGKPIQSIQKLSEKADDVPGIRFTTDNAKIFSSLGPDCPVAGGTSWLWARPEAFEALDVLFVDEAAQMSLANVLAVSHAAKTVVLLGDPRQLEQPLQGSHPEGTDVSALKHILGEHATVTADRGLFLEETWRLHPEICSFTSELFYEDRLRSKPGLQQQAIKSQSGVNGSGLRYLAVEHEGNQSASPEEADVIKALVEEILASKATWIGPDGEEAPVALDNILIIAPYNAQVFELQDRLPGARIGTVDKFQGQEAPIVIYSMTTSSHADAPRGMEFLYSANRLNVATSRARCVCILVGSPSLFEAECRTPQQMQLANAFCRYLEMAQAI
jgi:predicted RecB family nuclease